MEDPKKGGQVREKTWGREEKEERKMIVRKKISGRPGRKWEDERENKGNSEMKEWRLRLEENGREITEKMGERGRAELERA